jgi:putative colanic acid biosynthesis glycosyltransferase
MVAYPKYAKTHMNSSAAPDLPLVSVITVVRNGATTISETLDSVRIQHHILVEHIVIDGASSDGTVNILENYQSTQLRWISEPDQGIYDAMNKGIALARGEWLIFLGADDVLADADVLADIFQKHELAPYDLVCGCSSYSGGRKCVPRLDWHMQLFNTIHHQAAFYRRRLFDDFRYRLDIPVVADYEMNFRVYSQHRPALLLDRHIAVSGIQGISHASSQLSALIDAYRIRGRYKNMLFNAALLAAGLVNLLVAQFMGRTPRRFAQ